MYVTVKKVLSDGSRQTIQTIGRICKIGSVELTYTEAEHLYNDNKFVITYGKILKVVPTRNGSFKGVAVYTKPKNSIGLMCRGRFATMDADGIRRALGIEIVQ